MPLQQVSVSVEQNTYEFCQLLAKFLGTIAQLAEDGITFNDIPVAVTAILQQLAPAAAKLSKLAPEAQENLPAFMAAIELGANALVFELIAKK